MATKDYLDKPVRAYLLSTVINDNVDDKSRKEVQIVRSMSGKEEKYEIAWSDMLKRYTCTCPDWVYRRMKLGTDCKHIKAYKEEKGIE